MFTPTQRLLLAELRECARRTGTAAYLVGGIVRDLLLGHDLTDRDIDVILQGNALEIAPRWAEMLGCAHTLHRPFFTAKLSGLLRYPGIEEVDLASARSEVYPTPGVLPEVTLADINADLQRRDFSINAMALPLGIAEEIGSVGTNQGELVARFCLDPYGGKRDLDCRVVRILHPKSFMDDPTRLFRGCRYVTRIGGAFELETRAQAEAAVRNGALHTISRQRIFNELLRCCAEREVTPVFEALGHLGIFTSAGMATRATEAEVPRLLGRLVETGVRDAKLLLEKLLSFLYHSGSDEQRAVFFDRTNIPKSMRRAIIGVRAR